MICGFFFQIFFFSKKNSGTLSECQTVLIQIRPEVKKYPFDRKIIIFDFLLAISIFTINILITDNTVDSEIFTRILFS